MIGIVGKYVTDEHGECLKIEKMFGENPQTTKIELENGEQYDFLNSFGNHLLTAIDDDIQKQIMEEYRMYYDTAKVVPPVVTSVTPTVLPVSTQTTVHATSTKSNKIIKVGDEFFYNTNAELINALLQKDYEKWMKAGYDLSNNYIMWMVNFDGKWNNHWKDYFINDETVIEEYDGTHPTPDNFEKGLKIDYRAIFCIIQCGKTRIYKFKGVFKLNKEKTTRNKRVLELYVSKTNLHDF